MAVMMQEVSSTAITINDDRVGIVQGRGIGRPAVFVNRRYDRQAVGLGCRFQAVRQQQTPRVVLMGTLAVAGLARDKDNFLDATVQRKTF